MLPFIKLETTKYEILGRPYELVAHGGPSLQILIQVNPAKS